MKDLKKELFRLRVEFDTIQQVFSTKDEEKQIKQLIKKKQPLPEDIYLDNSGSHYRFVNADISKEDLDELLFYRQLKYLRTIKNCFIFFVVLTIIPIILYFFLLGRN